MDEARWYQSKLKEVRIPLLSGWFLRITVDRAISEEEALKSIDKLREPTSKDRQS